MKRIAVVAIGGNSLITDKEHQTVPDQYAAASETCKHIAELIRHDHDVVITHGNGPQVGFILRRSELAVKELHMVPLDSCVADTQGALGYHIVRALHNEFRKRDMRNQAVTVVTQVLVDREDPSFKNPTKPIGSFMSREEAEERRRKDGWNVVEDAGRGWRRVVSSPVPVRILELDAIAALIRGGFTVVAAGGGGIPVVQGADGDLAGAAAVIDKDLASSVLAQKLQADLLIISTGVEKVFLNFGKPDQKALDRMTVAEAKRYMAEGHFKPGSMKPKVQALIEFLGGGGKEGIITNPENLERAVTGQTGTHIYP
ncbi:MAG: carbamate kinase [Elusimicrobia bacterium GWA2_69_24]|nr:MAG: carbamate kinase [Elusimicrobia bacterium GWA2_69_24]HBL17448.1 carbamate kinase [Elusimicrobiota bacterium]